MLRPMRRQALFALLATLALAGCDRSETETHETPSEEPTTPTVVSSSAREVIDEAPDSPARFYERREGLPPEEARCPQGEGACVNEFDFAVFVYAPDWGHHYVLDYGSSSSPIREGEVPAPVWMQRVEQGVRHILAEEEATAARGRCGLAGMMPTLYGAPRGYFEVNLPPGQGEAPEPVTPQEANAQLQAAYREIGYDTEIERRFFDDPTMARMTADTFRQPVVTRRGAFVGGEEATNEALLFVVFSPESRKVYVLDRSGEHPTEETDQEIRARQLENQAALLRFLSDIGESPVAFAADTACEIPEVVGGAVWRPLSPPWQPEG